MYPLFNNPTPKKMYLKELKQSEYAQKMPIAGLLRIGRKGNQVNLHLKSG